MNRLKTTTSFKSGFTIIELVVVIVIIGILASITIVSYGAWRKTVNSAQVKSDLNGASAAMESSRNFNNIYPLAIPSAMIASQGVSLSGGGSVDGKMYCLDGTSLDDPTISYYIDSLGAAQGAQPGTCITRSGLPAIPSNLAVVSTTGTQINLSWSTSAGATGYTEQCASDLAYQVGMKQSSQAAITGSVTALNLSSPYNCRVRASNAIGSSGWSPNVNTTTAVAWTWALRNGTSEPDSNGWFGVASSADGTKLIASAAVVLHANPALDSNDLWTSTDSGATWTRHNIPGVVSWGTIASSSDGTKLVAAADMSGNNNTNALWTSVDSGYNWTQRTTTTAIHWTGLTSSSDGIKLAAVNQTTGRTGTLWTSSDSGVTWTQRTVAGNNWYGIASSSDGTKLVAVDFGGYAYTSTDSGVTWIQRPAAGVRGWHDVASSADGTKLVAVPAKNIYGANVPDYIFTSTDSGVTWTQRTAAGAREWYGVASSADGTKFVASSSPGAYLVTSDDSGATWTDQTAVGAHQAWYHVASSADGNKAIGAPYNDYLWTGVRGS